MPDLLRAEFQEAAVQLICERLLDKSGSRRFLLADEVGLGKTIVARGVLEELSRRKRHLDVVYLCSNTEIAEQNRRRLDPSAERPLRRVTELAYGRPPDRDLRVFSFTAGTSLRGGTGLAWERRLLLFLTHRVLRQDIRRGNWREFFRCGASGERWQQQTRFSALYLEFNRKLSTELQQLVADEWRKPVEVGGVKLVPGAVLADAVAGFCPAEQASRRLRNQIVAALRLGVQRVALDYLAPDVVILDEVQRFRDVIDNADSEDSIAGRLFKKGAAVLILSATPYRMLSLDHEGANHYAEFLATAEFLFGAARAKEGKALRADLEAYRVQLEEGTFLNSTDPRLLQLKTRLEKRLRKVMSRTERNWYIEERGKGIEERRPSAGGFATPSREELSDYVRLRRFLLDKAETSQHVTEYWKSCPAPFTFMDAGYVPMAAARRSREPMPPGLVAPALRVGELADRSLRFRELVRLVFGPADRPWRFLWTRPSYTYYRDEFFRDEDPTKVLIFSAWRFVPKAIALLASHEAESRIRPRGRIWSSDDQPPLRFTEKGSFHVFDVCCPSPALAGLLDPAALATENLTSKDLLKRAVARLLDTLASAGIEVADTNRTAAWEVVARLEARSGGDALEAMTSSSAYSGGDVTERFAEHADRFAGWGAGSSALRISRERLRQLAEIAVFSPANALLRAFWSVYPATRGTVPDGMVDLCFGTLRSYFNKRTARAIVEKAAPERSYARAVLRYCALGHFQALADEYLFLLRDVLQCSDSSAAAEHLGRVFGIGIGTPNINVTTRLANGDERLKPNPVARRSHFALAFGDDVRGEQGSPTDLSQSFETRKTAVREAFNSPFWPFILATTSAGQEGLDFHLFCRDVVHWNLPSNPVDLEQREGRINRRDGLALRRNIVQDWPLQRVSAHAPGAETNTWERVFTAIGHDPGHQRYKHGLFPHWVYEVQSGPSRPIRRHLFFYENSQDASRYEILKERLALYRLVFGQPRQQDIIERIRRRLAASGNLDLPSDELTRYMINLSPIGKKSAHELARRDAEALVADPAALRGMIDRTESLETHRGTELASVATHLAELKALVRRQLAGQAVDRSSLRLAAYALSYLENPYDALFDMHTNLGLEDDCAVIRDVAERIRRRRTE
ncbi:MAG: hypothetical protein ACLP66_06085 [Polyangia bacterium]